MRLTFETPLFTWYVLLLSFISGSIAGSFIPCMAGRISEKKDWIKGHSVCDHCGHQLGAGDLVPILSWLIHKGKCKYCGEKVPVKYTLIEIAMGVMFALIALHHQVLTPLILRDWIFVSILLGLSLVDLETFEIPDGFIIAGIANWLVFLLLSGFLYKKNMVEMLKSDLIGGIGIAGGMLLMSIIMDKIIKKESLGGGDIKLFFVTGLYLGLLNGFLALMMSCVIGLLFVAIRKSDKIPYGPSIAIATVICMFIGDPIVSWYLSLF